jgi:hypothetical protein
MAAKRDLRRGREPAKAVVAGFAEKKCRLGEVVLRGNGLQGFIGRKGVHRHNGGGVSGKSAGGEGVDLKYR